MKLALVYNPHDSKLHPSAYCSVFRGMFDALATRFEETQHVTTDCSADDIEADVIFFFDPHSSHHIKIDGLVRHPALKMEYWNDPHQRETRGVYTSTGFAVHKLGHKQRVYRASRRGVDYIVSPVKYAFYDYFAPHMGLDAVNRMLLHFPSAPSFTPGDTPLITRRYKVLANGATWGDRENNGYASRRWAYAQPDVTFVEHTIKKSETLKGTEYGDFLKQYAGALALCGAFPVVKYYEIPLAGCVCFAEYHQEYEELGFKDNETCVFITKNNFHYRVSEFVNKPESYQDIATAGMNLMKGNYTAVHFADFIYKKVQSMRAGGVQNVA